MDAHSTGKAGSEWRAAQATQQPEAAITCKQPT